VHSHLLHEGCHLLSAELGILDVAVHVAFERHILKPVFHSIGARVETTWVPGAFQLWVRGSQRAPPRLDSLLECGAVLELHVVFDADQALLSYLVADDRGARDFLLRDFCPPVQVLGAVLSLRLSGLRSLPGVRLVTWTILAAAWTVPAVIDWWLRPYALLRMHSLRVSDWLHGPYRLLRGPYRLSSTGVLTAK
jgi:hypothetical protein